MTITFARQYPSTRRARTGSSSRQIAPQLRRVGRFAHQVELVEDGLFVLSTTSSGDRSA
jgi:hypothetical protein